MLGPWDMNFAHEEKTGDDQAASVRLGIWFLGLGFKVCGLRDLVASKLNIFNVDPNVLPSVIHPYCKDASKGL